MEPVRGKRYNRVVSQSPVLWIASLPIIVSVMATLWSCNRSPPQIPIPGKDPIENAIKTIRRVYRRDNMIVKLEFGADLSGGDMKGFSDHDFKKLAEMADLRSLEELDFEGTEITDAGLIYLKDCQNLQKLYLVPTITDAGLAHLEPLSALRHLDLRDTHISNRGLAHIARLRNLEFLVLMDTNISDEGAKHLEGLHKLNTLYLGKTRLGDKGVQSLVHLQELRTLSLRDTQVGDAAAGSLVALRNLNFLNLENTQVTDSALLDLRKSLKLEELDLTGSRATQRGVEELRRAMPKALITYESHPVQK